ncbi:MAG: polyprenyl synthetase family protein [Oceanipulchritudo sp.]
MKVGSLRQDAATASSPDVEALIRVLCADQCAPRDPLLEALEYHLASGGKRARAAICLECSRALSLPHRDAVALATTVECLHNASLVQDDLQDRSSLRRGRSPVWKAFDENTSMCLTDLLLSSAFAALCRMQFTGRMPELVQHTHRSVAQTLRGQMQDTSAPRSRNNRLEHALQVAQAKSGPFFALALELPLIAAGEEAHMRTAREAARHFGIGYQSYDDLEDLEQDEREGNEHNVVLAFGESKAGFTPVQQAAQMALWHLGTACSMAGLLPRNCGAILADQAEKIRDLIRNITR